MASRRKMSRRPRKRAQTRRKRRIIRKKRLRSVRRYRRQKRSARTRSRLPKRLSKRLPKRVVPTKKVRMTRDAWGMLHSYVDGIYRKVSGEAERLRKKERRPSVISSDVQSALRQIMPKKESRRSTRIR